MQKAPKKGGLQEDELGFFGWLDAYFFWPKGGLEADKNGAV